MHHPELHPTTGSPVELASRWLVLGVNRSITPDQCKLCFRLIIAALMRLPDPADVSFHYEVMTCGTSRFTVRLVCMTELAAEHTARTARSIVRAIAPWLDVEVCDSLENSDAERLQTVRFALGTEETLSASAEASFLWTAVKQGGVPMRFSIALQRLELPQDEGEEVRVRAEATLAALPTEIDALAALVAVDAAHRAALRVVANDELALEGRLLTDIPTLARLLAGPFTVPALTTRTKSLAPSDFGDLIARAQPPHVLILGGSGGGKTTTLNHGVGEALRRGSTVVVFCPHSDLAMQAASQAVRAGVEPIVYDFGAQGRRLRWNVTRPDPGVTPAEWARRLSEVVRGQLWDGMPPEYFGPVLTRALPLILESLARDPMGSWPLTYVTDFLDRQADDFRTEVLKRIGDPQLTRAINDEVMPMITQRDPGNSAIWIISKLDPLIGDPTVRTIIDTAHVNVTMQPALEGRSIIVSVPQTVLTRGGSVTVAALLLERLWAGAQLRRDPTRPIEVFIDEWQNLPCPAIGQMLTGGRKFGLLLRLANQHLAQLATGQREAVLANSGLLSTFRTGSSDATTLDRYFPTVAMSTMQTLPKHTLAYTLGDKDGVAQMAPPAPVDEIDFMVLAEEHLYDLDSDEP